MGYINLRVKVAIINKKYYKNNIIQNIELKIT